MPRPGSRTRPPVRARSVTAAARRAGGPASRRTPPRSARRRRSVCAALRKPDPWKSWTPSSSMPACSSADSSGLIPADFSAARLASSGSPGVADEQVEGRALAVGLAGHARLGQGLGEPGAQGGGEPGRVLLRLSGPARAQRGDPGGGRDRVRVVRAGMADPARVAAVARQVPHEVRPAGHRAARHPAGQDLPERGEVGGHPRHRLHARPATSGSRRPPRRRSAPSRSPRSARAVPRAARRAAAPFPRPHRTARG